VKIDKIQKSEKVTKIKKIKNHQNWQNTKTQKHKKWQNAKPEKWSKKVTKSDPPSKRPKCHLNGQNRHFVKSEPPGPAFFEFQGVPRDPVLRPKNDPPILNGKSQQHFHLFHVLCISYFINFDHFVICTCWWNSRFTHLRHYNKALL